MQMNWQTYEDVVKNIYEVLGKNTGVKIECWGGLCKRKGKSGVEHQIDVLASHTDGVHRYLTAIECKYWNEKINKDIVMKVNDIVVDCNFDKGVIVSKLGFTEDAIAFAKFQKVELVVLREPIEEDWKGRVKTIVITIYVQMPNITSFENLMDQNTPIPEGFNRFMNTSQYYYQYADGTTKTIKDFVDDFIKTQLRTINVPTEWKIDFSAGTILKSNISDFALPVLGIKINGILTESVETMEIRGENYIWLIMKTVFENKQFVITHQGEIKEV